MLSDELRALIDETAEISGRYEGFQANVCINYGGRDEIVRAAMRYAEDYRSGAAGQLTEELFSRDILARVAAGYDFLLPYYRYFSALCAEGD